MPIQAKAAIWFMICSILQQGVSLITVPIFTRLLTKEEYGLYSSYVSWQNILVIFVSFRLDYTVFNKGMSKFKKERDAYVASMQLTTTIIGVISCIVYCIFAPYVNAYTEMPTSMMLLMIVQSTIYPAYSFWMLRERYDYRLKTFVIVVVSMTIMNSLCGLLAVFLLEGNRGQLRIWTYALVYIAYGSVLYFVNFRRGLQYINLKYISFAIRFNIPMIPHYLSTYILNQSDRIMIQKMAGMEEVAMYSVTYNAAMMMQIISNSLINSLTPWYYEKLENEEIDHIIKLFVPIVLIVAIPMAIFVLLAPEALLLLASRDYSEAKYIIPPVTMAIVFLTMYSLFSLPEYYYNANRFSSIISSVAAFLNIGLNYIGIKKWGYTVAGFTTFLCYGVLTIGHFLYSRYIVKKCNKQDYFNSRLVYFIIAIIVIFTVGVEFLYKYMYLRYAFILLIIGISVIFRKNFINWFKMMRKE